MKDLAPQDEDFMALAFAEAQKAFKLGEVPVGCVIVLKNRVIARAHNLREAKKDPTAHAEILAIKKAAQRMGGWRLLDTTIYVTVEPCAMCAGAIQPARIARVVFGAAAPKTGACGSVVNLFAEPLLNHHTRIEGGMLAQQCGELLTNFFRERRATAQ